MIVDITVRHASVFGNIRSSLHVTGNVRIVLRGSLPTLNLQPMILNRLPPLRSRSQLSSPRQVECRPTHRLLSLERTRLAYCALATPSAHSCWSLVQPAVIACSSAPRPTPSASVVCTNCGAKTKDGTLLCTYCKDLPMCRRCHRHLPSTHFCPTDSSLCQCCFNKRKYKSLQALGHVITEVPLSVNDTDASFNEYIDRNAEEIREVVTDYDRQLR